MAAGRGGLSPRELDVAQRLALGEPNKKIARALGISHNTVRFHVHQVLKKLGVENRTQAALAMRAQESL